MEQDVVDLPQQVTCGRLVGDGGVHLGQLQAHAYGDIREGERAGRPGSHRPRELAVRLVPVTSVHSEPGRGGKGEHAEGVVVQPVLIDGGERELQMFGRLRPSPAIHRQHRELGLAEDDGVDIAQCRPRQRTVSTKSAAARSRVAEEQLRLGAQDERHGAPGAPRRLLGGGEARVGRHLLWTGGDTSAARNMARAESNDAVPSTGIRSNEAVSRNAAHRCASAVCPVNTAIHPARTASGGYSSIAESPRVESHRCTVDSWPAW